ncbi:MAG: glycosyltransferase family 9 protein [Gemmatimonadaceae bacterium]
MIISTGVLRAIATSYSTIDLDVLASPGNASVLNGNPHVGRIIVFRRRQWYTFPSLMRELRRGRYDVVIDPMVLMPSLTTALLILATGAPLRIGIGGNINDFVYTLPVPTRDSKAHHVVQEAATAVPFGVDPASYDLRPELYISLAEREEGESLWLMAGSGTRDDPRSPRRILTNVSAALAKRLWPDQRYIEVLQRLRALDESAALMVIGGLDEKDRIEAIAQQGGATPAIIPIRAAFAAVSAADIVFTPDTSIAHAAAALRKPAVVMLVRGSDIFAPYSDQAKTIYSDESTLESLPVERALRALNEVLEDLQAGSASAQP